MSSITVVNPLSTEETPAAKPAAKRASAKKGHGRPFAKISQKTLEDRLLKLKKRIDKSQSTLQNAQRYYAKYEREQRIRSEEPSGDKDDKTVA